MDQSAQSAVQEPSWLDVVRDQVRSLRFGYVQIKVHNSQVVQAETISRIRFNIPVPESETGPAH